MKVISLRQPWAYLLCAGIKTIETRSFKTAHRGRLLIHASNYTPTKEEIEIYNTDPSFEVHRKYCPDLLFMTKGAIIGSVDIDTIIPTDKLQGLKASEHLLGDYRAGRYGWICKKARLLTKYVPAKGALSLWNTYNKNALTIYADNRETFSSTFDILYYGEVLKRFGNIQDAEGCLKLLKLYSLQDLFGIEYGFYFNRITQIEKQLFL